MSAPATSRSTHALAESRSVLDELISPVATASTKHRLKVIDRITDLFAAGSRSYSYEQISLFDDVLRRLSADIEVEARAKLAQRLAGMGNAPPKLVRSFAFDDEIEVAGPVLVHSEQLSDDDLVENATTKSQDHLLAIAQRLKLSEAVTDVLVDRGDDRVVHKVVRNKGARFSLAGYGKLTSRARYDRRLTLALGERSDLPRQYFLKLLEAASSTVRAKLEAAHPHAVVAIRDTVDDVATKMQREVRKTSQAHVAAVREAKRRFNVRPISEASVHGPAHAQDFEKTVVALSRLGVFSVDLVERALLDEGEDMVLLLAKAAGCSWTTARELLLMYAANRSLKPDDITLAFERYRKLSQQTARNIVVFYERRLKLRAKSKDKSAGQKKEFEGPSTEDRIVVVPSPSLAPI
ncbi:MAG TPA: DUF2336 domain-containing protein [Pseudolabrys sp.]|jgi:uncharacterized protein (DUF2336 family)|nr:DUF2336 domain-containing protein [Pseudolabrys sp.]